jgi:hypothetical protein
MESKSVSLVAMSHVLRGGEDIHSKSVFFYYNGTMNRRAPQMVESERTQVIGRSTENIGECMWMHPLPTGPREEVRESR